MKYAGNTFRVETLRKAQDYWIDDGGVIIVINADGKMLFYPDSLENRDKIRQSQTRFYNPAESNPKNLVSTHWVSHDRKHLAYDRILHLKKKYEKQGYETKIYDVIKENGKKYAKIKVRKQERHIGGVVNPDKYSKIR